MDIGETCRQCSELRTAAEGWKICLVGSDCLEVRLARRANARPGASSPGAYRITPIWRAGDGVRWQGRAGIFRRDVDDGEHAEIVIAEQIYRVRIEELR